jgi:hypothetical protein
MKKQLWGFIALLTFASAETDYVNQAMDALKEISTEQLGKIETTANSTNSNNEENLKGFVLSTQIKTFSDIPKNIDMEIAEIKKETRLLIRQIALDIEMNDGNKSGALSLDEKGNVHYTPNPNLPDELNRKRKALLEGQVKNNVSIRSAYYALKLLGNINNEIIVQAKEAKGRKAKEKMYMKQAVYVYEISDIVLTLLNELTLEGKNSIVKLHEEAKAKVDKNFKNIEIQREKAKHLADKNLISPLALSKELDGLMYIEKANQRMINTWDGLLTRVGNQEKQLNDLKAKRELIEYKQSKAKIQIETLRDLRSLAELKDSIGAIDDLVSTVDELDLLILDDQVVAQLLGDYDE